MKSLINKKHIFALITFLGMPLVNFSQEAAQPAESSVFTNPLFNTLLVLIILLLVIIAALSAVIKNLGDSDFMKHQQKNSGPSSTVLTIGFLLLALSSYSETKTVSQDWSVGGIDSITFYFMCSVILLELIMIASLIGVIRRFTKPAGEPKQVVVKSSKVKAIFDQLNDAVDVEKEAEILMDHDYDGIKELDNNLPPWWKYGFYLTIVVAIVYMIHYHGAKTGSLQAKEYADEVKAAEIAIAETMKNSASNVDEGSVKMLTAEVDLTTGKNLFVTSCAACHGQLGEGGVGPNLTDDYWVHGGSIVDIFKTVKYGWPDKGMKAWKEDLSPMQMAQVTSFIKSLRGTNPPKGKEKQGDLYVEDGAALKDSPVAANSANTAIAMDSLKK
ncbi:MAG: c-type cytochrome [Sphingobacteriaceae bacterium]|nr:c-type cytochrome [Sphingobacteriaceae bacterium]